MESPLLHAPVCESKARPCGRQRYSKCQSNGSSSFLLTGHLVGSGSDPGIYGCHHRFIEKGNQINEGK